ncbi:phage holin family protein [Jannaschia sp. LMIT008]|uniref:phage holin family protein n=1 Tax=Jannaschia maritima TaxID=3032585 RepID=UPI002811CE23|nr:phage holin family protein [Jannaschia sp. LMIT008]
MADKVYETSDPHVTPNGGPGRTEAEPTSARGASTLVTDVLTHVTNLVRKEMDLARTEISNNINRAGVAIGLLVGALVIALVALNVLAAALVAALTALGLDAGWAAIIVGGGLAVIAFAMVAKGLNDLKLTSLAPTRTMKNVERDAETVKETMQ